MVMFRYPVTKKQRQAERSEILFYSIYLKEVHRVKPGSHVTKQFNSTNSKKSLLER